MFPRAIPITACVAVFVQNFGGGLLAQTPGAPTQSVQATSPHAPASVPEWKPVGAELQTLLARTNFSPGLIDGKPGRKTRLAIQHFQRSHGLPESGELTAQTIAALREFQPGTEAKAWTQTYTITEADAALITGPIPEDWNERAEQPVSGYSDMAELLAERGWCSLELLTQLNPGVALSELTPGETATLPCVPSKPLAKISRIEISLSEKLVLGFDAADNQVMMTHCSVAAELENAPVGELSVKVVVTDPDYTFNPESWPEVDNVTSKLRIAPGPRNPVGLAWIGLDKPGYGIHGTVRPQDIGKTGSHGCFRLTNWDAVRLARSVSIGTRVDVLE